MPDQEHKLTKEEQQKAIKWFTDTQALRPCPACGHQEWTLVDQMGQLPLFAGDAFIVGAGFPAIVLVCRRCAYFRLHSAIAMGLVKKPDDKTADAKAEGSVTNA